MRLAKCRDWLGGHRWPGDIWVYILVPLVLVGLFADQGDWGRPGPLIRGYVSILITTICIGLSHHLFYALSSRIWERWESKPAIMVVYHAAIIVLATRLGIELTSWLHRLAFDMDVASTRTNLTPTAYVVSLVVVLGMLAFVRSSEQRRRAEVRLEQVRQEALRAQLDALRARTNPHFLFNSLNTVASLIESDPRKAEDAVQRLSSMFRYTLEAHADTVSVAEEVAMVRNYLETESLRFGDRLQPTLRVEPGLEDCLVPPPSLQPLVENAVVHGIDQLRDAGQIDVRVAARDGHLILEVTDNGPGVDARANGAGTGQSSLRDRLHLLYGDQATFTAGPIEGGYRAQVSLPLQRGNPS